MKKLLSLGLVVGTVTSSIAACHNRGTAKPAATPEKKPQKVETKPKPQVVARGKNVAGTFKLGVLAKEIEVANKIGNKIAHEVAKHSKMIEDKSFHYKNENAFADLGVNKKQGESYIDLPSQLFFNTSENFLVKAKAYGGKKVNDELTDDAKLAKKKLDVLFVAREIDGEDKLVDDDVYEAIVTKKQMPNTHVFFVGGDDEDDYNDFKKLNSKVSIAWFNKFAAAYIAGFQAAANAIKFDGSDGVFEKTDVGFLIGAVKEKDERKKAYAFRRGVEAAAAHPKYSKYLKVKFASKSSITWGKKSLVHDIDGWIDDDEKDEDPRLNEFASSSALDDADRKIIYIAGTTAKDWRGKVPELGADDAAKLANLKKSNHDEVWKASTKRVDLGLIGALLDHKAIGSSAVGQDSGQSSKDYWVILDKVEKNKKNSLGTKHTLYQGKDNTGNDGDPKGSQFERNKIKLYGVVGNELLGAESYVKYALKALYMGGASYMLGKKTIFGSKLDTSLVPSYKDHNIDKHPWSNDKDDKDSFDKMKDRFDDSLTYAWEKMLTEKEITKDAPWLRS